MIERDDKGKFIKKDPPDKTDPPVKTDPPDKSDSPDKKPPAEKDTGIRTPMEDLNKIADEIKSGTAPKAKKKAAKKRGRPKKKPEPAPEPPPSFDVDAAMMKTGIKTLFKIAAQNRGPHWQIEDADAETLAQVSNAMAEKWFPLLGPWMVEINFFGAVCMIVGPRLYTDYLINKKVDNEPTAK